MEDIDSRSTVMARLTISAIDRVSKDPSSWSQPCLHRALLVSGLSVFISSIGILSSDFEIDETIT